MSLTPAVAVAYREDLSDPIDTGTFNVAAGDLIVVIAHGDESGTPVGVVTVSDNQTPDLTWNLIAQRTFGDAGANSGYVGAWWAYSANAITGLVVTLTNVATGTDDCAIKVILISGNVSSTDPIGAVTEGNWGGDPLTTASITPETSGIGICAATDWNASAHSTTSSDLTITSFAVSSGNLDGCSGYKTLSAGVAATANLNAAGVPSGNYIWFEIRDEGGGGGGTTYNQSVSGTLTNVGALLKRTSTAKAGTLTSAGTILRQTRTAKNGSLSSAGLIAKRTNKPVVGTLSAAGVLAAVKIALKALTGTLASSGALTRRTSRTVAGSLSSAGALAKQARKTFTGALTSTGTVTAIKTALKSLTGTLGSSGTLVRQARTSSGGALATSGALLKRSARGLAGTLTSAGTLTRVKAALISLTGSLGFTGALARRTEKHPAGSLFSTGSLNRRTSMALTGALGATGAIAKLTARGLSGVLGWIGIVVGIGGESLPTLGNVRTTTVTPVGETQFAATAIGISYSVTRV
jgi:hypothetical protein